MVLESVWLRLLHVLWFVVSGCVDVYPVKDCHLMATDTRSLSMSFFLSSDLVTGVIH